MVRVLAACIIYPIYPPTPPAMFCANRPDRPTVRPSDRRIARGNKHAVMERRPPSSARPRIPGGYGNYPGRDPESPMASEKSMPGGGRKKRPQAPWGGLFQGQVLQSELYRSAVSISSSKKGSGWAGGKLASRCCPVPVCKDVLDEIVVFKPPLFFRTRWCLMLQR